MESPTAPGIRLVCAAEAHLSAAAAAGACPRPAQLVLLHGAHATAACRACAAVFALRHPSFIVLGVPGHPPAQEIGRLRLSGKQRSVYLHVLRGIRDRRWAPGHPVPTSAALADACRCARSTATRALRAAAQEGWIAEGAQYGQYVVAPMSHWPQLASRTRSYNDHERGSANGAL